MKTGPDQDRDARRHQPERDHGQQHDARGRDGQGHEEIPDEGRHVEQERLLHRDRYSSFSRSLSRCTCVTSSWRARKIGWSVRSCVKLIPSPGIGAR